MSYYIQVILPLKLGWEPYYKIDKALILNSYSINSNLFIQDCNQIIPKIGTRVNVNFSNATYIGVISSIVAHPTIDVSKIIDINYIECALDAIYLEEIKLWRFISSYYMCTIGEVYKIAYPILKLKEEEKEQIRQTKKAEKHKKNIYLIDNKLVKLKEKLSKKEINIAKLLKPNECKLTSKQIALQMQIQTLNNQIRSALQYKEFLQKRLNEYPVFDKVEVSNIPIELSNIQTTSYNQIINGFKKNKPILLNGVTGSGKTEIYINLAKNSLNNGKNVLFLVPEILLCNQLASRLNKIFNKHFYLFNSTQTNYQRGQISKHIKQNQYFVLGTRSALFLPHNNLGLIIVDEEHDNSYKQEQVPYYNGRDVAIILSKIFNCNIILGSATPSLESLYNCITESYIKVDLNSKFYSSAKVNIKIIDTILQRKQNGMVGLLSKELIQNIHKTLSVNKQVLLLRARRAYSPMVQCHNCGYIPHCPCCNVTLSYHKNQEKLTCHYCGYSKTFNPQCPMCNGTLEPMGSGTQKVEEEVKKLFPHAKIARLDSDIIASKQGLSSTLDGFIKGDIDILVGTQIITKGLDFENLNLVAIIGADSIFGQDDFRADEKALQLLEQFKGRSGRREDEGLFIIQTSQPQHPVYQQLLNNQVGIINKFLYERKQYFYPPYTRIVKLIIKDSNNLRLNKLTNELYEYICNVFCIHTKGIITYNEDKTIIINSPYSPIIDKISNLYIKNMRIAFAKNSSLNVNKETLGKCIHNFEINKKYTGHITIDVDPL